MSPSVHMHFNYFKFWCSDVEHGSLLGYSLSAGKVDDKEHPELEDIIAGAPRASGLRGQLLVFHFEGNGFELLEKKDNPDGQIGLST